MPEQTPPRRPSRFRPDIEGLRAVAVLMVLLFHAGLTGVPAGFAGVDVFFVISGFLITGLLLAEASETGTIRLGRFWARRVRRLLPASALVLVSTALLTLLAVPQVRWREIGGDIVASAIYLVNWRLADRSVDYLAEDAAPSPVQHFWSLAVEEQFYVLWPLLVLLAVVVVRRRRTPGRHRPGRRRPAPLAVVTGAILVLVVVLPSLAWSVHLTRTAPAEAYFVTTTRLWQLGVGALLALVTAHLHRLPRGGAVALGWSGLVTIVVGAALQGPSTAWPGTAALVPTLGAAAVLAAGVAAGPGSYGVARLLSWRPMQWVGGLSYSLYLWHWPLLVVAAARWGELAVWQALLVVALSFVPAWLGHRYVEQPVRRARRLVTAPVTALALAGACTVVAAAGGGLLVQQVNQQIRQAEEAAASGEGATVLGGEDGVVQTDEPEGDPEQGPTTDERLDGQFGVDGPDDVEPDPSPAAITPDPLDAVNDVPALYDDGCDGEGAGQVVRCEYGDPDGDLTVALVGDSKAAQWGDALDRVGQERGWAVHVYYRSACPLAAALMTEESQRSLDCQAWGEQTVERLTGEDRPDVVVVSAVNGTALEPDGSGPASAAAMQEGMASHWSALEEAGVPVVALADTPQPGMQVYACVADNRDDVSACTVDFNEGSGTGTLRATAEQVETSTFVDMNDWVCPGSQDECPPVVGEVLVYRQGSHITNTYAVSLAEVLGARLEGAFEVLGVG